MQATRMVEVFLQAPFFLGYGQLQHGSDALLEVAPFV